jgi:serine phosphatase RsbU (regulator of sigma subunit)
MVNSLRVWLISSFTAILLICIVAAWLFINSINQSKEIEDFHSNLKTTRILLLEAYKLKEDITLSNVSGTSFEGQFIELQKEYEKINIKTNNYISILENSVIIEENNLYQKIKEIKILLFEYNKNYNELISLYQLKGFKNYGLEGTMRKYAHNLYEYNNKDVKLSVLILRKHEKDFLLRKDLAYVNQFNSTTSELINEINKNVKIPVKDKNYLLTNINQYSKFFKSLSGIDVKIGIKGKNGYLNRSKFIFDAIATKIEVLENLIKIIETDHKEKIKRNTFIVILFLIIFLISTIIIITQIITQSVRSISNSFSSYVNSGFNHGSINFKKSKIKEFNAIYYSFLKMAKEINLFTNFFKEKVHERTLAINQQKDEILLQQEQIENQYKNLLNKNSELKEQKELLALKNTDVLESLRYAKRIQTAIQPGIKKFKESFDESFVFSKARDVVSGDFYLIYKVKSVEKDEDKIVFFAADCTGHGVPGAMMSVLGINILNKLVKELKNTDPGKILNALDKELHQILAVGKKENNIVADGMDIAVFSFDKKSYVLEYSIAKFGHFLVRDSEIISFTTQKTTIGYSFFDDGVKKFETSSIKLNKGDCLYLFSDGMADQFGGPHNKKFKKSNILKLIQETNHKSMYEQKTIFRQEFTSWKKKQQQIDDVLVIGIRF